MSPSLGILHLTTYLQGGAGRAITDLACAQRAAGHRVTVVTSQTATGEFGNYPEYLAHLRDSGVTLHTYDSLFARDLGFNMRVVDSLCRVLDATAVDLIHAHAAVPAFIGRLYGKRIGRWMPVVQTQHGWGINKTAAQASFDLEMLRSVDRVITTSRATADLLANHGAPVGAMNVIPCGLPVTSEGEPPADAATRLAGLRARGGRLIGCIGTATTNKNQTLLVDALGGLAEVNAIAVFVGDGSEAVADYARRKGVADRVVSCGYHEHAAAWLPLFDVIAVPSRTEGQGLVVLEAFRAGVPVVASNIAALAELVEDGRTGLLFPSDDATALAGAIRRAFAWSHADREAVREAARGRFLRDFTVEGMVARHEALYRELVAVPVGAAGRVDRA